MRLCISKRPVGCISRVNHERLVERDQHWWANNVDLILEFWKEVEYYKDNIDELYKKINNKNSTFYVQNSNKCLR